MEGVSIDTKILQQLEEAFRGEFDMDEQDLGALEPESQTRPKRLYIAIDGTTAYETDGWLQGSSLGCRKNT